MLNGPFSPWPSFTQEEADSVSNVLLSNKVNYWTGQEGRQFETEFAAWSGSNYAIAVGNGTLAIDLALVGLGIKAGDEVIVTSRTYLASVSSIITAGAVPVFADVDLESQNITPDSIKAVLSEKTKAIICVHLAGWPCEMDSIMALANERGLLVIEDCAQAHGAKYKGQSVGSFGHVSAWSFCQDKIMTTGGEGGMVTTSDEVLWKKMWAYKDHGKSYDSVYNKEHPPGFRWVHDSFGTNWRLTEMQSAIGRIQLRKMADWTAKRTEYAHRINAVCQHYELVRTPIVPWNITHAYYKHYVFLNPDLLKDGWNRNRIIDSIFDQGVPCLQGSCSEVYREAAFDNTSYRPAERLPNAKRLGETSLMFLVHPTITLVECDKMCAVIEDVLGKASKA